MQVEITGEGDVAHAVSARLDTALPTGELRRDAHELRVGVPADLKNSSHLREGSPVLAAEFLREFAGDGPWAHVDMAGPGFIRRRRPDYALDQGGTGYGVRLIVELAQRLSV